MSIGIEQRFPRKPAGPPGVRRKRLAMIAGLFAIALIVTSIAIFTHAHPGPAEPPRSDSAVLARKLFSASTFISAHVLLVGFVLPMLWSRRLIHVALSAGLGMIASLLLIASIALALA
jgi:hypothetical protein